MGTSFFQALKLDVVSATGLSKDALHLYAGLSLFVALSWLFRKSQNLFVPWLAILVVALGAEVLDRRDDISSLGHWRWKASVHDILNTLFWPTVLVILLTWTSTFGTRKSSDDHKSSSL